MSLKKKATIEAPHATFEGHGPWGPCVMHVLKTYKTPSSELKDIYARWMIAAQTEATGGGYDIGDRYKSECFNEIIRFGYDCTYASDAFKAAYPDLTQGI